MAKRIDKKPNAKPSYASLARDGEGSHKVRYSWENASWTTDSDNSARATGWAWWCTLETATYNKTSKKWDNVTKFQRKGTSSDMGRTYAVANMSDFTYKTGTTITRSTFYPLKKRRLTKAVFSVAYTNTKGTGTPVRKTLEFKPPRKPSISVPQYDEERGEVSVTVTTNAGEDLYERYDTYYEITSYDTRTKKSTSTTGSNTSTSFTLKFDVADIGSLDNAQYVKIRFKACARGYMGDSAYVERVYYVGYPNKPEISGIRYADPKNRTQYSLVHVGVRFNDKPSAKTVDYVPADFVKLEALVNTEASTVAQARLASGWQEVTQDDRQCISLATRVSDCTPERGNHSWVRIKTWHASESTFYRYSEPMELSELYKALPVTPPTSDDLVKIGSATPIDDSVGAGIKLVLAWAEQGTSDNSTGTEVSWSEDKWAWLSDQRPKTWTFTYGESKQIVIDGKTYTKTLTVYLRDVEAGKRYYIRARRYAENDGETTYAPYDRTEAAITAASEIASYSVSLAAPELVISGNALRLSWEVNGEGKQASWRALTGTHETYTDEHGNVAYRLAASGRKTLASGSDGMKVCSVNKDIVKSKAVNGVLWVAVQVTIEGTTTESDAKPVEVVTVPTAGITVARLTAQPLSFTVTSTTNQAILSVNVRSTGCSGDDAILMDDQLEGDTVWTAMVRPTWTGNASPYTTTVTAPDGIDLRNGSYYEIDVNLTDERSGLKSETVSKRFFVRYAATAKAPSKSITVTPSDVTDEDGIRTRSASIALAAPSNAGSSDVYDIFRVTADGPQLVLKDCPLTGTVYDQYAPFGDANLAYRVCTRTPDGAVNWADYSYEFGSRGPTGKEEIRIDFGDSYVEVDKGVTLQSSWQKDFTTEDNLSGTTEGYWGYTVKRTGSAGGQLVKVYEQDQIESMRALARYVGPCFVRTSSGEAYSANVDVSPLGTSLNSAGQSFQLKMTEVSLVEEHGVTYVKDDGDASDD